MSFVKGVSGNPSGRPKGSPTRKWANVAYWFAIIEDNLDTLKPYERIQLAKWAMEILIGKMKEITTPDESKANAEATAAILKELEATARPTNPGS